MELEDVKFHQCVRLARFENDRTISFIPPDGNFDLMTYRLSQNIKVRVEGSSGEVEATVCEAACAACQPTNSSVKSVLHPESITALTALCAPLPI